MAFSLKFKIRNVIFIVHWSLKVDHLLTLVVKILKNSFFFLLLVELCLFTVGVPKKEKKIKNFFELLFTNNIYMKQT
jgi:hypothetical protein